MSAPQLRHRPDVPRRRVVQTTIDQLATVVGGLDDDDVVVALDPERAVLVAGDEAVAAAVDQLGDGLAGCDGSIAGRADAVRAWLAAGRDAPADPGHLVFHPIERSGSTLVVHGRLVDAAAGTEPVVAVGDAAERAWLAAERADAGGRDLARLLRYDDAAADGPWAMPAPELVTTPFWTPAFCATVIRAAEATGAFGSDPHDPVPGHELSLAAISPRLFAHVEDDVLVRVMPVLQQSWPAIDYAGLRDAFVIKFTPAGQAELPLHHDVAQISASVRLNDGYDGGQLTFPRQGFDNGHVPVGTLLAWPSLVTHPHRSARVRQGVKYSLTVWFEVPDQH